MEYILVIAFAVGLLLFLLSWLRVIFAGFRHHSFTGLVSAIPVVNLLVLPTVWHRVYGWVMTGLIGLLVAIACWFAGADQRVYRYSADMGFNLASNDDVIAAGALDTSRPANDPTPQTAPSVDTTTPAPPLPSGKELPKTALFQMSYKPVNVAALGKYTGQYIRITQLDHRTYEGKLLGVEDSNLTVERRSNGGLIEHKVNFNDIVTTEVMSKE